MTNTPFDTTQPSQVKGLKGYTVDPIFTVGDTIAGYTPPGILDGTGAFELNKTTVRVLVNHELANNAGYAYTLKNGTSLTGARISYFDIDKRTLKIVASGLAYNTIYNRAGEVVDAASDLEFKGLNRFCAANLMAANQFGKDRGLADTIYFAGEETDGGTQFALDVKTGELWALPWLGRAAWESTTELDTGRTDKVALLIGDDRGPAPLILYIGDKNAKGDRSFLDRNGLAKGKLYVWVADDANDPTDPIERNPQDFRGTGNSTAGKFVEIDYYRPDLAGTNGYDAQGFATQAKQDELATAVKAFFFSRPEDVATNPKDGTQAVLASTGRTGIFNNVDTWGTTYKIDVDFNNINAGNITAKIDVLYDGDDAGKGVFAGPDYGLRSPDNLDWADDGKIYIQEDRAISSTLFGATSKEEASIWSLDPSAPNPAATLTRVAQVDRSALPTSQTDSSPTDLGNWETSGILDVSTLFGNNPGELLIIDVQAHSLRNGSIVTATNVDGDGNGTPTANENLVEGGQLAFLIAPNASLVQEENLVAGTAGKDDLVAGVHFDGVNDVVFTGSGDDQVDVPVGGALRGNNRIHAGSGNDVIIVGDRDRAFGGSGNDELDATDATNYRISGGAGDDTFFLGANGRALGGDGDDVFYVQDGGGNLLSGGAGADKFWIVNGGLPSAANTILDFELGTDVLGIFGQGAGFDFSDLTLSGNNIAIGNTIIATLQGVNTSNLTAADFVFS